MTLKKIFGKGNKKVFRCECCGTEYDEMPLCFGADYPIYYYSIPPEERGTRIELEKSLCVIDGEHFFHRGRLTIPIVDHHQDFYFDVWTSISAENFQKRIDDWNNPDRIKNGPYFGWLQTQIPTYENTINIKSRAIEQEVGHIPEIEVGEEGHRLTIDQKNGITIKQALEIAQHILREQHMNE